MHANICHLVKNHTCNAFGGGQTRLQKQNSGEKGRDLTMMEISFPKRCVLKLRPEEVLVKVSNLQ